MQKLEQLARRQQDLAKEQAKQQQQSFQQRWEQEQLRREAEELRKKLEQLTRGDQQASSQQSSSQGSQSSSSGQQSSSQSSSQQPGNPQSNRNQSQAQSAMQRGRQAGQQNSDQRLREAFDRLTQATDDMRKSANPNEQGNAGARRAAERLQEAKDLLRGMRQQQSSTQLDDLSQRADQLAAAQREFTTKMRKAFGAQPGLSGQPSPGFSDLQQLASEKDKMGNDLEGLERDTQKAARDLAGSQPAASSKLREGLGELQQNEVHMRMKMSSQWIRRGRGQYLVAGESVEAMALNKLADAIKEAKNAVGKNGDKPGDTEAQKALARVEKLREQLERAASSQGNRGRQGSGGQQGQRGQEGQQPGQQGEQGGKQGQQGQGQQGQGGQPGQGQQSAQQGGQQGQQGQDGQRGQQGGQAGQRAQLGATGGGDYDGGGTRNRGPLPAAPGDAVINPGTVDTGRAISSALRDLSALRQAVGGNTDLGRQIGDVVRDLQRPGFALAGPALNDRLTREVLPAIEQLEMQLRSRVEGDATTVRNPGADRIPPGYGDKVADYFRRLSKTK